MLDFILKNENYDVNDDLYYNTCSNYYLDCEIKKHILNGINDIENIINENYIQGKNKILSLILNKYFFDEDCILTHNITEEVISDIIDKKIKQIDDKTLFLF